MNYEQLFSFVVFAEHRNFTRAAEQLHLSQPALHVQVKKLTEAVGRPLYRKEGRSLFLTDEGERLAAFGRQVKEQGSHLVAELTGGRSGGPLVFASGQGAFIYLLGQPLQKFPKTRWPLRLQTMSGPDAVAAVRSANSHLAVIASNEPPRDLDRLPLRQVGQVVVVPGTHRLARRKRLKVTDLEGEPLVVAPSGSPHRTMLNQMFVSAGLRPEVAMEANGWALMMASAKYGIGLAVVNDFCPPPRGMKAIALLGAPPIQYLALSRPGMNYAPLDKMLALVEADAAKQRGPV